MAKPDRGSCRADPGPQPPPAQTPPPKPPKPCHYSPQAKGDCVLLQSLRFSVGEFLSDDLVDVL
ncbi:MAG: hypothetical protein ACK55I_23955, partial [bacterium]